MTNLPVLLLEYISFSTAKPDCNQHKLLLLCQYKWLILFFLTNLDSIMKSRNITLSTKVRLVKAMVFPVVRYGCESWTVKHPISCIKLRLAIRFLYDIIHVSKPFSQIIPPSPSPTESKRLFYTSVSLCYLVHRVIVTIFLNSIYMHQYTVLVFFFLAYFTMYNRLQSHPPHQNCLK